MIQKSRRVYNFKTSAKDKKTVLGIGYLGALHVYVRDMLFPRIKILTSHHLESNGEIISECLEILKIDTKQSSNFLSILNEIRTEIRKTMCSRRGYVKRQISILLKGKICFYN